MTATAGELFDDRSGLRARRSCPPAIALTLALLLLGCQRAASVTTTTAVGAGKQEGALELGAALATKPPGSPGGPAVKGVWLAENFASDASIERAVDKARQHGLNTILPNVRYADKGNIARLARAAALKGIDTQLWLEEGIKHRYSKQSDADMYLSCSDGAREVPGIETYYLDVRKAAARRFFIDYAVEWARTPGVSAMQYDDHVGYYLKFLPCTRGIEGTLAAHMESLVAETSRAVRQANPRLRFEFSHHNAGWAKKNFAVEWPRWLRPDAVQGMYTQAYVNKSVRDEIGIARATKVKGLGLQNLMGPVPDRKFSLLVSNAKAVRAAGLGVIFFKWPRSDSGTGDPSPAQIAQLSAALGGPPPLPQGATVSSGAAGGSSPEGSSNAGSAGSAGSAGGEDSTWETEGLSAGGGTTDGREGYGASGASGEPILEAAAVNPMACAAADRAERQARYAQWCVALDGDIATQFDACERQACQDAGGGRACTERDAWNRKFFCRNVAPRVVGPF